LLAFAASHDGRYRLTQVSNRPFPNRTGHFYGIRLSSIGFSGWRLLRPSGRPPPLWNPPPVSLRHVLGITPGVGLLRGLCRPGHYCL